MQWKCAGDEMGESKRRCHICGTPTFCYEVRRNGDPEHIQWLCVVCVKELGLKALKR